jgi:excisionase family DNA binding protein
MQPEFNDLFIKMIDDRIESSKEKIEETLRHKILVENKPVLTVDDLCQLTGLKKSSVYRLCSLGKIGHYRPTPKLTLFTWQNVNDFLLNERCYIKSKSEIRRKIQSDIIADRI